MGDDRRGAAGYAYAAGTRELIAFIIAVASGLLGGVVANYATGYMSRRRLEVRAAVDQIYASIDAVAKDATDYWAMEYAEHDPEREPLAQILAEQRILAGTTRVSEALGNLCEDHAEFRECRDQMAQFRKAMTGSERFREAQRPADRDRIGWIFKSGEGLRSMLENCYRRKFRFHT